MNDLRHPGLPETASRNAGRPPVLSRRHALKAIGISLVAGYVAPAQAATPAPRKVLIVYYSRTGNTRQVARQIQGSMGGDLLELKTAHSYPDDYQATTEQAKREQETQFRPTLTTNVESVRPYDLIFIGYPNWWGTMPMALFSFLEAHDFSGKTLVPFCTHGGSALGRGPRDIARLCPQAHLLDGLAIRGSQAAGAQREVDRWLRRIGLRQ